MSEGREEIPPYRRIAADIRDDILSGRLGPGEQVPSITALAAKYGVARNTAIRALKVLADEKLIRTEQGWGSFVTQPEDRS